MSFFNKIENIKSNNNKLETASDNTKNDVIWEPVIFDEQDLAVLNSKEDYYQPDNNKNIKKQKDEQIWEKVTFDNQDFTKFKTNIVQSSNSSDIFSTAKKQNAYINKNDALEKSDANDSFKNYLNDEKYNIDSATNSDLTGKYNNYNKKIANKQEFIELYNLCNSDTFFSATE